MQIKNGENMIDGVLVTVERKKTKRINLRVKSDGAVRLSVPVRGATLAQAGDFLAKKWDWVKRVRERIAAQPPPSAEPTPLELARLQTLLVGFHSLWAARLGEHGVAWKLRKMKTRWGVCNWVRRRITYSEMLVGKPPELVEYVVVHEFAHFSVHSHGPRFHAVMDALLPDWRERRRRLRLGAPR